MSSIRYLRIYTGADGESHFSDDVFELETMSGLSKRRFSETRLDRPPNTA